MTTDENGTYHIVFNSGDNPDDTDGPGELGSHGLIAWIGDERIIGGRTLLIDSEIHEMTWLLGHRRLPSRGSDHPLGTS